MSEYRKFGECIICRTKKNLQNYTGDSEVTMLLNSLYMAVMFPLEKRGDLHVKSRKITKYLSERQIIDKQGNDFNCDDIVRYLRNSLAHYNIEVSGDGNNISSVKLWGINSASEALCKKNACENPKCIPKQFNANQNGEICTFIFSINDLRDFTFFVIDMILKNIDNNLCINCLHKQDMFVFNIHDIKNESDINYQN